MYSSAATAYSAAQLFEELIMAQRPTADYPIDANTTSGTDLSLILNRFQTALESGNSGSSRPAYITAGGLWVKEGDPMELYLYDGTTDQLLYDTSNGINVTEGLWTLVDENNEAGQIQRPSDVLIDGNLTVTGDVVDADGNPISIIDPATEDGVVATWDSTAGQWTPDSSLTIDSSGNATFSGTIDVAGAEGQRLQSGRIWLDRATANYITAGSTNASAEINFQVGGSSSDKTVLRLLSNGDATFSGTVSANCLINSGGGLRLGIRSGKSHLIATDTAGNNTDGTIDLGFQDGTDDRRWRDAYFSGTVSANQVSTTGNISIKSPAGYYTQINPEDGGDGPHIRFRGGNGVWYNVGKSPTNDKFEIHGGGSFDSPSHPNLMSLDANGNVTFGGTVNGVRSLIGAKDLIETLSTLRNATKDENTLEGLRDAIGNAVGSLIDKFEAIQAEAKEKLKEAYNQAGTQEITPDKGTKDDTPAAGTLDLEE